MIERTERTKRRERTERTERTERFVDAGWLHPERSEGPYRAEFEAPAHQIVDLTDRPRAP
jgi:hypothetical protein